MFNKKQKNSKGFTLIELLVVIAIIGLLAGIVLVSLGGARESAKDARIIASLSQTRSVAELVANSNNGLYETATPDSDTDVCDTVNNTLAEQNDLYGTELAAVETEVVAQGGSAVSCQASTAAFCIYATLNNGQYYCIDSTASSAQTATVPSGVGLCTATTYLCP